MLGSDIGRVRTPESNKRRGAVKVGGSSVIQDMVTPSIPTHISGIEHKMITPRQEPNNIFPKPVTLFNPDKPVSGISRRDVWEYAFTLFVVLLILSAGRLF